MRKINRDPAKVQRVFWHLNPKPPGAADIYHVAYVARERFVTPSYSGGGRLEMIRGTIMDAACGDEGRYAQDSGYLVDSERGRSLIVDWVNPEGIICERCAFIEGKHLLVVPDDSWMALPPVHPHRRSSRSSS